MGRTEDIAALESWLRANVTPSLPESWKRSHIGSGSRTFRRDMRPLVEAELKRLKAKRAPLTSEDAIALRREDCVYCGGAGGTVDHIVPVAAGGGDDRSNLTSACRSCNSRKGTMPLLAFLAVRTLEMGAHASQGPNRRDQVRPLGA